MKVILAIVIVLTWNLPVHAVTIETVPVGNPGNAPDSTGLGTVGYPFRIGKLEITNSQYTKFLNSVDPTGQDKLDLYSTNNLYDNRGGINFAISAANGSKYSVKTGRTNRPAAYISWYSAIRFANWLHNGQGNGSTETGAYTLLGGHADTS